MGVAHALCEPCRHSFSVGRTVSRMVSTRHAKRVRHPVSPFFNKPLSVCSRPTDPRAAHGAESLVREQSSPTAAAPRPRGADDRAASHDRIRRKRPDQRDHPANQRPPKKQVHNENGPDVALMPTNNRRQKVQRHPEHEAQPDKVKSHSVPNIITPKTASEFHP
jgi:hypothetical protein